MSKKMKKDKKIMKTINKEGTKTKRSQSKEQNGKTTTVQELRDSLNYLHPKNQLTKEVYETVCEMQELIDKGRPGDFVVSFSVSHSFLSISIQSKEVPELCVWDTNEDTGENLVPEFLITRYRSALKEALGLPEVRKREEHKVSDEDVVEECCDSCEEGIKEPKEKGFFIGRYISDDEVQILVSVKRSTIEDSLSDLLEYAPPCELPSNGKYYIFKTSGDEMCYPIYRWTKKGRWKLEKKDMAGVISDS